VHIVGGDKRRIGIITVLVEPLVNRFQFRDVVLLKLKEEVVFAEYITIPANQFARLIILPGHDSAGNLGRQAAAGGDQTLGMRSQEVAVHARRIIKAV
jgi:hypothetical protein